jgi:hypothetical protein
MARVPTVQGNHEGETLVSARRLLAGTVPDKGDVLLGGIATDLILFLRGLVNAVRTSSEEVSRVKTMD